MNQNEQILQHLRDGNSITPLEALNKFNCFRLSARIFNLKEKGHDIVTVIVNENGKKYASYFLKKAA